MPRYCTAAWGFREFSMGKYFEAVKELGFDYVELDCEPEEVPLHLSRDMMDSEVNNVLTLAEESGVKIVALATGNDFTVEGQDELNQEVIKIKKVIDLAQRLGAEVVRLFAGWIEEEKISEDMYHQLTETFALVGDYARERGVKLALENHGGITKTAEQVKRILESVKSPAVGLNFDPANFYHCGQDPVKALEILSPHIVYFHLKDCRNVDGKYEYCAVGDGEIDFKSILGKLTKNYHGYYAIEYEETKDVIEGTRRSLEYIKSIIEKRT